MTRAEAIVFALGAQSETIQTVRLADGAKAIFAIRENFVDINLMAHVPDKFVLGRIKDTVQRNGQFDDAKIRAEMAAAPGESGDQLLADFTGQFLQLRERELFDVFRPVHHVEVSVHRFILRTN